MKKFFLFILATMLAGQTWAQNFTIDNLNYEVINTGKKYVSVGKAEIELKDSLVIPSKVKNGNVTYTVISIADFAFYDCSNLTSVIIPESVTSIGRSAFCGCSSLASVIIPYSVGTIYEEAFRDCSSLTSIVIPRASPIKKAAFSGCVSLTSMTLPAYSCGQTESDPNMMIKYYYPFGYIFGELKYDGGVQIIQPTYSYHYYYDVWFGNGYDETAPGAKKIDGSISYYIPANLKEIKITKLDEYSIPDGAFINCDNLTVVCGHKVVTDAAVAATCTKSGLTEGKHCSVCNAVLVAQETIAAKGHTEIVEIGFAATCTESGKTEGRHCSVCNKVLVVQTEIPALGHEFVNYVYNNDATTEADGTETATCERGCGATDTRVAEGTKFATTAVTESDANTVSIYTLGSTIVVENATDEILVYNAMGALVCSDAIHRVRAEITVNGTGVYIVKTGSEVKRVIIT